MDMADVQCEIWASASPNVYSAPCQNRMYDLGFQSLLIQFQAQCPRACCGQQGFLKRVESTSSCYGSINSHKSSPRGLGISYVVANAQSIPLSSLPLDMCGAVYLSVGFKGTGEERRFSDRCSSVKSTLRQSIIGVEDHRSTLKMVSLEGGLRC